MLLTTYGAEGAGEILEGCVCAVVYRELSLVLNWIGTVMMARIFRSTIWTRHLTGRVDSLYRESY